MGVYIPASMFRYKAKVYKKPEAGSLAGSIEPQAPILQGSIRFASPKEIDFYKFSEDASDLSKTILYCRRNNIFVNNNFKDLTLDFSGQDFINGTFIIDRAVKHGAYYKIYLRKA